MAGAETDDRSWRELAERLLQHPFPGAPASRAEVFKGGLPPGWPAELPLPNGARLLGSLVHSFGDFRSGYMAAVLDADGTPLSVLSSYQTELGRHGWAVFEMPLHPRFGFVSGENGVGEQQSFLQGDEGPLLTVTVMSRDRRPCDVRLRLDAEVGRPPGQSRGFQSAAMERIPHLRAPSHVALTMSGGGGGSDRDWTTHATARTDMAVGNLEAHFASQLSEVGWTRLGRGDDGVVAWSSWRLPSEEGWKGLLLVHAAFYEDQRSLLLRIEATQRGTASTLFSTSSLSPA